jgi:integrase
MIVRIKGVKAVRSKGRVYYYHRKTMFRLPGEPGSAEFMAKLRELDSPKATNHKVGALGGLIAVYKQSPEYMNLAQGSKREYGKALKYLKPFDTVPLIAITDTRIYELRDRISSKYSRSAANRVVGFLRLIFSWGMKRRHCTSNPALNVDKIRRPKDAKIVNRRYKDDELETVLNEAPNWLRVPIAIAAYTGMRESDVVRVTWRSYNGMEFEARQMKTGEPIWVKAHFHLREILDAAPRTSVNIVVGIHGRPMSANSLASRFFEFISRLQSAGKIEPGLSFHGLRHTCGTRLAEAGCDAATIAAVLGQLTTKMGEHYSRTARRHHLATAAIERIEEHDRNKIGKTRIGKTENG